MSDRVKVGTSKVTFRVRAFEYPQIELASVEVDVPMYTKTDNKLDNMQQGHVTAGRAGRFQREGQRRIACVRGHSTGIVQRRRRVKC